MHVDAPKTVYLKDYTPPAYKVKHIDLRFEIFPGRSVVHAKSQFVKNHKGNGSLFLNGAGQKLLSLTLNGKETDFRVADDGIYIENPGDEFTVEISTEVVPEENTALEGLYCSSGTYCTQCEAEGFRRITYFPDRPDIMATFTVRVEADQKTCPVLLSNGNLIEKGALGEGRHFTVWNDPTPKPCYLFALVAGDLVHVHDTFTTMSGNKVDLYIHVRKGDEGQCSYAMESLIRAMKWEEDVYGLEYQYNIFNIVAVSDFNMAGMENTSLNIFNTSAVLVHPDTATDNDFLKVERVIGHEYFHNWAGNRVTCRDWFQLSLKEGLVIFREEEFAADVNSRPVERIDDVMRLRRLQFPEDGGPLAHPIRPDNYIEINNFYTMTVYLKGGEVIRMFHTLLGPETYRKATDLYFMRHDGQAVTCDDWTICMEDASGQDLSQFKLWYSQAGTPEVEARGEYNETAKTYTLTLKQTIPATPGQPDKRPMHIPVAVGLVGPNGDDMIETQVLHLTEPEQTFIFKNIGAKPVPSILRNFSAPVKLKTNLSDDDLKFLMVHDSDGFNRWEAGQNFVIRAINGLIDTGKMDEGLISALEGLLDQAVQGKGDKALLAKALMLPDISMIGQSRDVVDPDAIYKAWKKVRDEFSMQCREKILSLYKSNGETGAYSIAPDAMGRRALKNTMLYYLNDPAISYEQYQKATNMTDRVVALTVLADHDGALKEQALADFYRQFKDYPLVIDKWFRIQSGAINDNIIVNIKNLSKHPDFNIKNPNRARALYAAFSMNNPVKFHATDGSGYSLLKDVVITLNGINPQVAAWMLIPFREWRRYTQDRQAKIKSVLQEIVEAPNLSPDVYEIVSKSLKG